MTTTQMKAEIRMILDQGDIEPYIGSLASRYGITEDDVRALVAGCGPARVASDETIAQERLAHERTHKAAWRAANHEED